jgi:hypothetical protein
MRHIGTAVYAFVMTPLAWFLLAAGQDRYAREFATVLDSGGTDGDRLVLPVLTLAVAGVLLGLACALRFSPLGATLAGVFLVAAGLGPLVDPRLRDLVDHDVTVAGHEVDLSTPVRTGTALLLGSLLLVGVVSVQRWRRWPASVADPSAPDGARGHGTAESDRPLGVDGLGLTVPSRWRESAPRRVGIADRADDLARIGDDGPAGDGDRTDRRRTGVQVLLSGGALARARLGDDRNDARERAVPEEGWSPRTDPSGVGAHRS